MSTGTTTTQVTASSVIAVRTWNTGKIAYIQYADGAVEKKTGNRAWRDNNPGNLRQSKPYSKIKGSIGADNAPSSSKDRETARHPYAMFGSAEAGRNALGDWLSRHGTQTINQAISIYAPIGDANNPAGYANFVSSHTGVSGTSMINSLTSQQRDGIMDAISIEEGFTNGGNATIVYNGGLGAFSQ